MASKGGVSDLTIPELDKAIENLMKCKPLPENDVNRICNEVSSRSFPAFLWTGADLNFETHIFRQETFFFRKAV